ncbi:hypothetical protein AAMO2058_001527700 [Amorphochlora amoebiformis]|eukprot:1393098-Amorphochlora_amoeboformis.AAC.1
MRFLLRALLRPSLLRSPLSGLRLFSLARFAPMQMRWASHMVTEEKKVVNKDWMDKDWVSSDVYFDAPWSDFHPRMDIQENSQMRSYALEVPGMVQGDLNIVIKDGMLTVRGYHEEKKDWGKSSRSFMRSFTIPEDVDVDRVTTEMEDGKLMINMTKKMDQVPDFGRRISVSDW